MEGAKKTTGEKRGRDENGEGGAVRRVETRAAKRRRQETELWDASFAGNLQVVRRSLAEDQSALNKAATTGTGSEKGDTALICAVRGNQLHVVRFLVGEAQADVNVGTRLAEATPLYIACQEGHLDIVRLLVGEAQADVDKAMTDGFTPLFVACQEGHLEIVRFLVGEAQANVEKGDSAGYTPLFRGVWG